MSQKSGNTTFNRRKFFVKTSLFAGAAAFGITGGGLALENTHAASLSPDSGGAVVPLYRLRHNGNTDHFYTTNAREKDDAVKRYGYVYEGIQCYVFATQTNGSIPLYRLRHNGGDVDHFYTTSADEKNNAVRRYGYTYEGTQCYVLQSGSVPLYRFRHDGDADHFYTTDPNELNSAIKKAGYTYEGVACYVLTHK
jgi:hypothetical protein